MKTYTVTFTKKIVMEVEAENCFDVDNKAKNLCPEGFELSEYFVDDLKIVKK